jgi:O-antigen ligase
VLHFIPDNVLRHFAGGITLQESSAGMRVYQINASIPVFLDHPVWGVGLGQVRDHIEGTYVDGYVVDNTLHVQPLLILIDAGLAGFVAYAVLLVSFFAKIYLAYTKNPLPIERAALGFGIMAFAANMTHFLAHPLTYFSVFGAIYGLAFAGWANAQSQATIDETTSQGSDFAADPLDSCSADGHSNGGCQPVI